MKNIVTLVLCLIMYSAYGQKDKYSLKDIEIPSTPAVALLDENITNISQPVSTRAFGLSLINSFKKSNGIPSNYAVEFNPYWLFKNSEDSITTYLKKNKEKFSGFKQNSSFSFAFVKNDSIQNAVIGIKTNIFKLVRKGEYQKKEREINYNVKLLDKDLSEFKTQENSNLENQKKEISDKIDRIKSIHSEKDSKKKFKEISDLIKEIPFNNEEIQMINTLVDEINKTNSFNNQSKLDHLKSMIDLAGLNGVGTLERFNQIQSLKILNQKIKEITNLKPYVSIDIASAFNYFFDNNTFSSGKFGRFGIWGTANFNTILSKKSDADYKKNYLNLYLFGRYIKDEMVFNNNLKQYDKNEFYDLGGKLNFEFDRLSFGYEYIRRTGDHKDYRSVGSISYKINENVSLEGGFGKNFERKDNLITTLGLRWGINFNNDLEKE